MKIVENSFYLPIFLIVLSSISKYLSENTLKARNIKCLMLCSKAKIAFRHIIFIFIFIFILCFICP